MSASNATPHYKQLDLTQAVQYALDDSMLPSLMETFHSSLIKEMDDLQRDITGQQIEPVRQSLHALKGFLPIFCRSELAQEVISLEALARQVPLSELQSRLGGLIAKLGELLEDVRVWRGI